MPPAAKRNCSVILYDYNTRNPELAKSTVLKILGEKWFRTSTKQSKDITRIIFTNVDKTSNTLNVTKDGYENIYAATDKLNVDPMNFARIFNRKLEPSDADWLEALQVAINCLKTDFIDVNGIVCKQLLFVTDLSTPLITSQSNKLKAIIRDLNEYKIYLYIVGPEVTYQHPITNLSDVRSAMKTLKFSEENENTKMVREIIENIENSVVSTYKVGIQLFTAYLKPSLSQPWQVPLAFSKTLELATSTVKVTNDGQDFILVEDKSENPSEIIWVEADNENVEVDFRDTIPGIERHGKFVPMDSEINAMLKYEGPRKFSLIGFTNKTNIPEYFLGRATYAVIPNQKSPDHSNAFYSLVDYLDKAGLYGIAVQCYMANVRPKYNVLIPKSNHDPKCFYMIQLPYADDITFEYTESTPQLMKNEEDDDIFSFLESIDIHSDKCEIDVPLTANLTHDINDFKIIDKALEKYLGKLNRHFEFNSVNYDPSDHKPSSHGDVFKKYMKEMKVEEQKDAGIDENDDESDFEFQDDEY